MEPILRIIARDRMIRTLYSFVYSNFLKRLDTVKVLDVGCANGFNLREMVTLGIKAENCTGIDIEPSLIDEAKRSCPVGMNFHCQAIEDLPISDEKFDIIITSGFFAYFTNEQVSGLSTKLKQLAAPQAIMVSSNYDLAWQKNDGGQLRSLDLVKDGIRSFDFTNNELNNLLQKDFLHLLRFPHLVAGHHLTLPQIQGVLRPGHYSSYESFIDKGEITATSYLDYFVAI